MTQDEIRRILGRYDVGPLTGHRLLGGTAARKYRIDTPTGSYVLRERRDPSPGRIAFDHALRAHLVSRGIPAVPVIPARDGSTVVTAAGGTFDLSPFRQGSTVGEPDARQLAATGRALARLHTAAADFGPPGARGSGEPDLGDSVREDHLSMLIPVLDDLEGLARTAAETSALGDLRRLAEEVCGPLDRGLYHALADTTIHGDFHPGNVFYGGTEITAVLDLDWAHRGTSLRDIGDGLMFFCARRSPALDPDDIRSLLRPWTLETGRCCSFIRGYTAERPLPPGTEHLGRIMLSRWLQCRIRGSRKVPPEHRVRFATSGIDEAVSVLRGNLSSYLCA